MTEPVTVAAIGAVATVLVAAVTVFGARLQRGVTRIRHQVENDHSTNMRVENDERHEENKRALHAIWQLLHENRADLGGVREEIRDLHRTAARNRDRIHDIEITLNPKEKQ